MRSCSCHRSDSPDWTLTTHVVRSRYSRGNWQAYISFRHSVILGGKAIHSAVPMLPNGTVQSLQRKGVKSDSHAKSIRDSNRCGKPTGRYMYRTPFPLGRNDHAQAKNFQNLIHTNTTATSISSQKGEYPPPPSPLSLPPKPTHKTDKKHSNSYKKTG